ncbi:MAG: hypothetical protein ACM359_19940 [Bacillota bacterium]
MDPTSTNPTGPTPVPAGIPVAELQVQPGPTQPPQQPPVPTLSPADQRLCNIGGRAIAWFVFLLGVVSALGSAWIVYRVARWLWSGGLAHQLSN